jgi:hypothetical protein
MTDRKTRQPAKRGKSKELANVPDETNVALDVPGRTIPKIGIEGGQLSIHGAKEHQAALDEVLGSTSKDYVAYAMIQVVGLLRTKSNEDLTMPVNAALAFIQSIEPRNAMEGALAAQMFATHHLSMEVMRRAAHAERLPQYEAHGNLATKLHRTFLAQLDGLGRHRRGGKQIVEHVTVAAGGQAVIAGTLNTGGGA